MGVQRTGRTGQSVGIGQTDGGRRTNEKNSNGECDTDNHKKIERLWKDMTGYTRDGPDKRNRKETRRTQIDRWQDSRTARTTMVTTEPDGRNNIQNGLEAGQLVGTDCRRTERYRPKYYKHRRTSGWSSRTDDWEDGPDAWLGDNRQTSKERTKCIETAKVAG